MDKKNCWWWIIGCAILLRLLCLCFYPDPHFDDSLGYQQQGQVLASHGMITANHIMPLYPLLALLTGGGIYLKCLDILLSVVNIWLIYQLTSFIFKSEKAAMIASTIAAFYPHFIFFSISQLTETSYITLTLAALLCLYQKRFVWGSIFLVLGILERPTMDLINPILIGLFAFSVHRLTIMQSLVRLLYYGLIYLLFLSPWWLHNIHKYHQFVRLNLGDGIVWYSGNNPLNQSGGGVAVGDSTDDMDLSPFALIEDPVVRNEAMKKAAIEFIQENPQRFIELAGLKFIRFWRLWPYTPHYQSLPVILISILSYGPILLLFLAFLLWDIKRYMRLCSPFLIIIGYFTLVHMILIGSVRYRIPLEPLLIICASFRIERIMQKCNRFTLSKGLSHA